MAKTSPTRRAAPRPTAPRARAAASPIADEQNPRRMLMAGAGLLLFGLATVAVSSADAGAAICLIGLVLTIAGIHFFGRLGPDQP
ncbi:MAG: hypothetical protein U0359_31125 [Byssovorax sp.]